MQSEPQFPNLLIVIGASAGGLLPIRDILARLPQGFQATVIVATHRDPSLPTNTLAEILAARSNLIVREPVEGESLHCTTLYVGHPSDSVRVHGREVHLEQVTTDVDRLRRIDELFASAAASAKNNAVGVILSGMLWDGVAGLQAIHDAGGKCLVQSPHDASFEDMPRTALANVPIDFVGTTAEIADALVELAEGRRCR